MTSNVLASKDRFNFKWKWYYILYIKNGNEYRKIIIFFFISSLIYTIDRNYERFKRVVHFRFRRDKIFDQLYCLHQSVTQIYWSRATRATSNGCLRTEDIKLLNVMHALWARIVVQRENSRRGMRELRISTPFMHKELFQRTSFQVFRYLSIRII